MITALLIIIIISYVVYKLYKKHIKSDNSHDSKPKKKSTNKPNKQNSQKEISSQPITVENTTTYEKVYVEQTHKKYDPNKSIKYKIKVNLGLKDKETLNKIYESFKISPLEKGKSIWETCYKKETTSMLGNMKKSTPTVGIYKITNTLNKKVYIGQSKDVVKRLRTHVRCGVGAEYSSQNELYLDMMQYGPENFTFEILETCKPNQLDSYEKYWISYFDSYNKGYNKTSGNG